MINAIVEKQLMSWLQTTVGPQAWRVLEAVDALASRQGGATVAENYQLLGKRAAAVGGAALAVAQAGVIVGSLVFSRRRQNKRIQKAVKKALEDERRAQDAAVAAEGALADAPASDVAAREKSKGLYQRFGKRVCDIAVSVAALPVVGIAVGACGVAIKREDGGPVFYNAPRVGKDGREFTMYKLRSMHMNAPDLVMEDGSTYNGADDPRMTKTGAFMRKTSLDEIPQFLNVLKGDMSVVGPRPDLKRETELYQGDESLKLTVKPGVTGYAAVYGRNSLPWHDRLALDVYYVRNMSFLLDVKVFFRTFLAVFKQEGIYVKDAESGSAERSLQTGTA